MKRALRMPLEGNWKGDARLYRLEPPYVGQDPYSSNEGDLMQVEYVIVSAATMPFSGPETFIFPASAEGEVQEWLEMEGSFKGGLNHRKALKNIGYEVVDSVRGLLSGEVELG